MPGQEIPLLSVDLAQNPTRERAVATRNRVRLLEAARQILDEVGPESMSMDAVANAAGVGKGTLFRRFGSRTGLLLALLDHEEHIEQQAFMFGPPPLGPDAPPLTRLIAFGRARLAFLERHLDLARATTADADAWHKAPPTMLVRTHIRSLLAQLECTGDLDAQTHALMSIIDPGYVHFATTSNGQSLAQLGDAWQDLVCKVCAR
ncbi:MULTISPECIES: TetR/AcrR family transcriptional regulator [Mycobacteroides]|jgi:AcrR family transcriptional regulator|uniref:TetR family transcriptional regulator n=1 Tax=Mycobacteroides chelonae TaxID=1774 RepID=A0A1S1LHK5_MYCCH|nr:MULTISPECIES: TetR/AcrR family transcriptional regulator [Mycobacteroides]KRQ19907.1 TetR family transcriptional regulator [Mycobacteroides sp. H003]KRQ26341.1 TetR family transcriptional regulator [Mycobacteroides sp. H092]KRQ37371.1 TetR family transcriptional regulator [Mycobacteroides sp. H101]KRQ49796.1 TetR family transcriptional regulator [Mycobacteroides sp. H063]KRQ58199.1 TetR family transcriptional regulator [Mycobacteroides sp. H079]